MFYSHKQPRGRSTTSIDPPAQGVTQEGYETFGGLGGNGGLGSQGSDQGSQSHSQGQNHGNQGQIQGHNNGPIQGQVRNQNHVQGNHGQGYIMGAMPGQAEGQMNHNNPQNGGGPHQEAQYDVMHAHPTLSVTHSNNVHSHHNTNGHGKEEGADV